MKIAILGTKGIPNNYGGYEQFAEFISQRLVNKGHQVTVYNPSFHKYKGTSFNEVQIVHKFSPESLVGSGIANIIYDFLCLKDALQRDFDIIYEAGYHSVAISYKLLRIKNLKRPIIITNMDGLEWKRSKWSKIVQAVIKKLEKIAVNNSPFLISDNLGIQNYLKERFSKDSYFIPYGADLVEEFDEIYLAEYSIRAHEFFILVARLEPENNVETIIQGYVESNSSFPLIVVGNHMTTYGNYLKNKYPSQNVQFVGGVYSKEKLDSLRFYSLLYFHGHSVGGTNPSLLEAMACKCFIAAHNNPFNESILGKAAYYFKDYDGVCQLIKDASFNREKFYKNFETDNSNKIRTIYNWDIIVSRHEKLFHELLGNNSALES
jgi:glycosyltransferase involved in cell wall biosynthesis